MTKSKKFDVRIKTTDYEDAIRDALSKGYETMSAYVRALLKGEESVMSAVIQENNKMLQKIVKEQESEVI